MYLMATFIAALTTFAYLLVEFYSPAWTLAAEVRANAIAASMADWHDTARRFVAAGGDADQPLTTAILASAGQAIDPRTFGPETMATLAAAGASTTARWDESSPYALGDGSPWSSWVSPGPGTMLFTWITPDDQARLLEGVDDERDGLSPFVAGRRILGALAVRHGYGRQAGIWQRYDVAICGPAPDGMTVTGCVVDSPRQVGQHEGALVLDPLLVTAPPPTELVDGSIVIATPVSPP